MSAVHIDYPFHVGRRGRTALTGDDDHLRDMIEQLLFTSPGERVNRPDFGTGLLQMLFLPNGAQLAVAVQATVRAALQRWLGDLIEVREVAVAADEAAVRVLIRYAVRATGEPRTLDLERTP